MFKTRSTDVLINSEIVKLSLFINSSDNKILPIYILIKIWQHIVIYMIASLKWLNKSNVIFFCTIYLIFLKDFLQLLVCNIRQVWHIMMHLKHMFNIFWLEYFHAFTVLNSFFTTTWCRKWSLIPWIFLPLHPHNNKTHWWGVYDKFHS